MRSATTHRALRRAVIAGTAAVLVAAGPAGSAAAAEGAQPFVISGDLTGVLSPGKALPLDLQLFNPNAGLLTVTSLSVSIDAVIPAGQGTCTTDDFAVEDVATSSLLNPLLVSANSGGLLSALGLAQGPQVRMVESGLNQDGCKGAVLRLRYAGTAQADETEVSGGGTGTGGGGGGGGGEVLPAQRPENLPGTGADSGLRWLAALGLGLASIGSTALRLTRRSRSAR